MGQEIFNALERNWTYLHIWHLPPPTDCCVTHWVQKPKSLNLSLCVVQLSVDEDALVQGTHTPGVCLHSLLVTIKCHLRTVLWTNANMHLPGYLNRTEPSGQACTGSTSSLYLCFKYTPLSWNRLLTECACVRLVSWEPTGMKLSVGRRAPLSSGPHSTSLQLCETHTDANHSAKHRKPINTSVV